MTARERFLRTMNYEPVDRPLVIALEPFEAADLPERRGSAAKDDAEVAPKGPGQPPPRIRLEIRMRGNAFGDQRVRQLKQQRTRAGPEEQECLAIDPPRGGAGAE